MKKMILFMLSILLIGTALADVAFYTPMDVNGSDVIVPITGTLTGDALITPTGCFKGSCLELDGNGDYDDFGATSLYPDDDTFTVRCAWKSNTVYPTVLADPNQVIIANYHEGSPEGGWYIGLTNSGSNLKLYLGFYGWAGTMEDALFNASEWYVTTIVYDENGADKVRYFINGQPDTNSGNEDNYISPFESTNQNYIGRWSSNGAVEWAFNGTIDECKIFDTNMSDAEVLSDYESLLPVPTLELTTDFVNNTVTNNSDIEITFNGTTTGTNLTFDCYFYNYTEIMDSMTVADITSPSLFDEDLGGVVDDDYEFRIECSNNEVSASTGVYKYNIHVTSPLIDMDSPANNSVWYKVVNVTVPVAVEFINTHIDYYNLSIRDSSNAVIYENYTNVSTEFLTSVLVQTDLLISSLATDDYHIDAEVGDVVSFVEKKTSYFSIEACPEVWQPYYTACSVGDNQTLYYLDANACGTYDDLPVNNGTLSSCNYCTIQTSVQNTGCVDMLETTYYQIDNYGSCCALTGLSADCNVPANTTSQCVGVHSASDIPAVVIDTLAEIGIAFLSYVPLIVLIGLFLSGVMLFKRG